MGTPQPIRARNLNDRARHPHLRVTALLALCLSLSVAAWLAVQSSRPESLATLVWAPGVASTTVMETVDAVLEPLGQGWWWVRAAPPGRRALRAAGAQLTLAIPTPIFGGGCSGDAIAATSPTTLLNP